MKRAGTVALLLFLLLAVGCQTDSPPPTPCPPDVDRELRILPVVSDGARAGYCHLEAGNHGLALSAFADELQKNPDNEAARFGTGWTLLLLLVNDLYTELWKLSRTPERSVQEYIETLNKRWLASGVLDQAASLLETSSKKAWQVDSPGTVLRVGQLELYLDYWEFDNGDSLFLAGILRSIQTLLSILSAHDFALPAGELLNAGAPMYTLIRKDADRLWTGDEYENFLTFRSDIDYEARMDVARQQLVQALRDWQAMIPLIAAETDQQSWPDNATDYPDFLSEDFLDFDGTIFIPGIFGPSPTTAILQMLFLETRTGVIQILTDLFPGIPAALPDAWPVILGRVITALDEGTALKVGDSSVPIGLFFSAPLPLRSVLQTLSSLQQGGDGLPDLGEIPNRVDPDKLPWDNPALYEPVPTRKNMEKDRLRGLDGPSAELHSGNGVLMAGFTREGRLKNLFYPSTTSYNLIPYQTRVKHPYLETEPVPYMAANPEHGSFAGIRIDGDFAWPMDWLDYRHYNPMVTDGRNVLPSYLSDDQPVVKVRYSDPASRVEIRETAMVPVTHTDLVGPNLLIRQFEIINTDSAAHNIEFTYYGAFDLTNIDQFVVSPKFSITWLHSPNRIQPDGTNGILWTGSGWQEHPQGDRVALLLKVEGGAPTYLSIGDPTVTATTGAFSDAPFSKSRRQTIDTEFGNGAVGISLGNVAAGQRVTATVYLSLGSGNTDDEAATNAHAQLPLSAQKATSLIDQAAAYWKTKIASAHKPETALGVSEASMYRKATMALLLDQSRLTGALPEMWDMQPMWFMIWPGNGCWHASALDVLGFHDRAERYFAYLERTQARDGHWRMAYTSLGVEHGAFEWEAYQTAVILWYAWAHWQMSGNDAFLTRYWPMFKKAADLLLKRTAQNRLQYATADFVEDFTSIRQSLFTNSLVVSGLIGVSEIARKLGHPDDSQRWMAQARQTWDAAQTIFWDEPNQRFFEQFDMNGRHTPGGVPTMVWPFHAYEFGDPKVTSLVEKYLDKKMKKQDWLGFVDSGDWTPGLTKNAAFYYNHYNATGRQESLDRAEGIVDGILRPYNLTLGGFISERFFGYGVKGSGKPLLWPHSNFVFMMNARDGTSPLPLMPLMGAGRQD